MRQNLDELDLAILNELQRDARVSNREVARRVGTSEGTVRARLRQMEARGAMRIVALTDPTRSGMACVAYICLEVEPQSATVVGEELARMPELSFVSVTLGRFNVIVLAVVESRDELATLLADRVLGLPGVRRSETLETVHRVKHDARWVQLRE